MSCSCKETARISEESGRLFFSFENSILIERFKSFLDSLELAYQTQNDTIIVKADNLNQVLYAIVTIDSKLLHAEKEAIKVLSLRNNEELNFESIAKTKTLQQVCDLYQSEFLMDILDNRALTSHFQPIVDIRNKMIFGYECLIRGVKDDGSLIYPDLLFNAAKRSGLTFNLDRQARETSLKTGAMKKIKEHLFINFLPTAIYNPETCLRDTFKWIESLQFNSSQIVFEVVETEKVDDFEHLANILSFYKKRGVKTALDDVGAGFSNLNALIKLRPDIIKIDREIIDGVHSDKLKQSIFEALVRIAKENNIIVLAEGVEDKKDYQFILQQNVDLVQGYYFGKPHMEPVKPLLNLY